MMLIPEGYKKRLVDAQVEELLHVFGAVQIDGPKWCGKTWTGKAHARSVTSLDDRQVLMLVQEDESLALVGDRPHLIDEWQTVPSVRDAVRHAVDDTGSKPGSFILTGSSAPPREQYQHSGAGRIAHTRMRTMSLLEQGLSTGEVSLQGLFEGEFTTARSIVGLNEYMDWVCRGGWPASEGLTLKQSLLVPRQYLDSMCEDNAPKEGRDPRMARRVIASLARNNTTAASLATISADLFADDEESRTEPARATTRAYISFLASQFLIEELNCWDAPLKSRVRMRTKPKRYFTDPSLAAAALGVNPGRLLTEGQLFGDLFENLALRDLWVYASAWKGPDKPHLFFYRDENGLESDVILEMEDGRWAAIEIKLGDSKIDSAVRSLLEVKRIATQNPKARQRDPEFLMVLVGNTAFSRKTKEGVYVVPLSLLGN